MSELTKTRRWILAEKTTAKMLQFVYWFAYNSWPPQNKGLPMPRSIRCIVLWCSRLWAVAWQRKLYYETEQQLKESLSKVGQCNCGGNVYDSFRWDGKKRYDVWYCSKCELVTKLKTIE